MNINSDSDDGFLSQAEQKRKLEEAEEAAEKFQEDTAKRVIFAWHSRLDVDAPHVIENGPDVQTSFCNDCSTGPDPVEADFYWKGWGSLCAHCSLLRFKHGDNHSRIAEVAERRWSE